MTTQTADRIRRAHAILANPDAYSRGEIQSLACGLALHEPELSQRVYDLAPVPKRGE